MVLWTGIFWKVVLFFTFSFVLSQESCLSKLDLCGCHFRHKLSCVIQKAKERTFFLYLLFAWFFIDHWKLKDSEKLHLGCTLAVAQVMPACLKWSGRKSSTRTQKIIGTTFIVVIGTLALYLTTWCLMVNSPGIDTWTWGLLTRKVTIPRKVSWNFVGQHTYFFVPNKVLICRFFGAERV